MARRRARKTYPNAGGYMIRLTRPTPAEARRIANSGMWRVGADLVDWVRQTAIRLDCTQGDLVRALLLAGQKAFEADQIVIENGRRPRVADLNAATDPLGRLK